MPSQKRQGSAKAVHDHGVEREGGSDGTPAAAPPPSPPRAPSPPAALNIHDLKDMSIQKLTQMGKDLNVAGANGMRKQDLNFQIPAGRLEPHLGVAEDSDAAVAGGGDGTPAR